MSNFTPLDLCKKNVDEIISRCEVTPNTNKSDIRTVILFPVASGYSRENERAISFNRNALLENRKSLRYMFGQISAVHHQNKNLYIEYSIHKYDKTLWTKEKIILLEMLYLACTEEVDLISSFNYSSDSAEIHAGVLPTLSPDDPEFSSWWEIHRKEWED